jgi:hypothetical protein
LLGELARLLETMSSADPIDRCRRAPSPAIEPPTIVLIPPSSIAEMWQLRSIWADGEDEVLPSARIVVTGSAHRRSTPPPSF